MGRNMHVRTHKEIFKTVPKKLLAKSAQRFDEDNTREICKRISEEIPESERIAEEFSKEIPDKKFEEFCPKVWPIELRKEFIKKFPKELPKKFQKY